MEKNFIKKIKRDESLVQEKRAKRKKRLECSVLLKAFLTTKSSKSREISNFQGERTAQHFKASKTFEKDVW